MKKDMRKVQIMMMLALVLGMSLVSLSAMEEKTQKVDAELTSGEMDDLAQKAEHRHKVRLHKRSAKDKSGAKQGASQEEKVAQADVSQAREEELKQAVVQARAAKEVANKKQKKLAQEANNASRYSAKDPKTFRNAVDAATEAEEEVDQAALTEAQAAKKFADHKLAMAQQKLQGARTRHEGVDAANHEVQAAEKEVAKVDTELALVVKKVTGTKVRKTSREELSARKQRAASEWFAPEKHNGRRGSDVIYDHEKHTAALKAQEDARRESDEADKQLKDAEAAQ